MQLLAKILPGLLIVCLVPIFALLVYALTGFSKRFVGSFVLALHTHAFMFCATALTVPTRLLFGARQNSVAGSLLFLLLIVYLTRAFTVVHNYRTPAALARALVIVLAYGAVGSIVMAIALEIVLVNPAH
jgi:hypothetical protein